MNYKKHAGAPGRAFAYYLKDIKQVTCQRDKTVGCSLYVSTFQRVGGEYGWRGKNEGMLLEPCF